MSIQVDKFFFRKSTAVLILISGIFFISGCSDSDLEKENSRLKMSIKKRRIDNASLQRKIKNLSDKNIELKKEIERLKKNDKAQIINLSNENSELKKEIDRLREHNKGLNVSLAKSELEFSKKHREELERDRKNLEKEKEAFKEEKNAIIKKSYETAENAVSIKYIQYMGGLIFISIMAIGYLLSRLNGIRKEQEELKNSNSEITTEKENLEEEIKAKEKKLNELEIIIENLKLKQKAGTKNKIVSMIEEYKVNRDRKLDGLGG
jgi:cell division protein FtsB